MHSLDKSTQPCWLPTWERKLILGSIHFLCLQFQCCTPKCSCPSCHIDGYHPWRKHCQHQPLIQRSNFRIRRLRPRSRTNKIPSLSTNPNTSRRICISIRPPRSKDSHHPHRTDHHECLDCSIHRHGRIWHSWKNPIQGIIPKESGNSVKGRYATHLKGLLRL